MSILPKQLQDEKFIVYFGLFVTFILATILDFRIGMLLIAGFLIYAIALGKGRNGFDVFQWGRKGSRLGSNVIIMLGAMLGFFMISSLIATGQLFALDQVVNIYSIDALNQLALTNPIIEVMVWGVLFPIAETLLILGVMGRVIPKLLKATPGRFDAKGYTEDERMP